MKNTARFRFLVLVALMIVSQGVASAAAKALLVGIGNYDLDAIPDLEGPLHDVESLHRVLTEHWGFESSNITTLLDEQATESNILNALADLANPTDVNESVLFYFSGHGTSAEDKEFGARLNLPDGSGALVAYDFNPEKLTSDSHAASVNDGLIVGRYELKPLLEKLDRRQHVLVAFDTCFSGNTVRQAGADRYHAVRWLPASGLPASGLPVSGLPASVFPSTYGSSEPVSESASRTITTRAVTPGYASFDYENIVYFGAAAEHQLAVDFTSSDIQSGRVDTVDGKPHGSFTDALLRALLEPGLRVTNNSYGAFFARMVDRFNQQCFDCGHHPVALPGIVSDTNQRLQRPFLGRSTYAIETQSMGRQQPSGALTVAEAGKSNAWSARDKRYKSLSGQDHGGGQQVHFNQRWLRRRLQLDSLRSTPGLRVELRHPLQGQRVYGGEELYFNVVTATDARLVVLHLSNAGDLSLLYPVTDVEFMQTIGAGQPVRIPDDQQLPLIVGPPWGIDTVLVYAFPTGDSRLIDTLRHLSNAASDQQTQNALEAFDSYLETSDASYSYRVMRIESLP